MDWIQIASLTTAGGAGVATADSGIVSSIGGGTGYAFQGGILCGILVDFTTEPATTDVTISEVLPNNALRTLLTLTNVNADISGVVQLPNLTSAGAAGTGFVYPAVGSRFQVTVAQGDNVTNGVIVYFLVM